IADILYNLKNMTLRLQEQGINLTTIVLAHTDPRKPHLPLTLQHCPGYVTWQLFFDTIWGLSSSAENESLMYLKPLKTRTRYNPLEVFVFKKLLNQSTN